MSNKLILFASFTLTLAGLSVIHILCGGNKDTMLLVVSFITGFLILIYVLSLYATMVAVEAEYRKQDRF